MKASTKETPVKDKKSRGGRPRTTNASRGAAKTSVIRWAEITDPAGSANKYEISSEGQVRRMLKSGKYKPVKSWTTGGPYAAVYLYGFPNVTRHRKKCYIHRLVATHFIKDKKKGEVVHHLKGPSNNQARNLDWVPVEENLKARKYLDKDGKPRKKGAKKVIKNVPKPNALKDKKEEPHLDPKPLPREDQLPDKDEYIPNRTTVEIGGHISHVIKMLNALRLMPPTPWESKL